MVKAQCLGDVAIKMNSSVDCIDVLVANLKPLLQFFSVATSHKHCLCTITDVLFGNLRLFASYAILMRPRNLKTAANKT